MAGPIVSLQVGYKAKRACAKTWAEECQNAVFPSLSFQVNKLIFPSFFSGVEASTVCPLNLTDKTLRANPSLILLAISKGVIPCA